MTPILRMPAAALLVASSLLMSSCEHKTVTVEEARAEAAEPEKQLEPWDSVDDAFKGCELG